MKNHDLIRELRQLPPDLEVNLEFEKLTCSCVDGSDNPHSRCYCPYETIRESIESVDLVKLDTNGKYCPPTIVLNLK